MREYGFSQTRSRPYTGEYRLVKTRIHAILCREGANTSYKNDWWVIDSQNDDTNFLISQVEVLKLVEF